ncbi:response regulator [Micromonospora sp. WMMD961]|uniref:response regulator n=1 Tax=Micromonospora sp. WMMD961 TaxID=3016100 RepID=UPI0024167402|nr:response regulator [Micromonospora sp. WMMD961]MDG4782462.1 response regulator [Micromonospora sp. WMMD961]
MAVTVVVVDDDAGFRRVVTMLLTTRGLSVVAQAVDGASGIEAVRRHAPDAVLLDLNLPDQDGLTVARALRLTDRPPTVVLTSTDPSPWPAEELTEAAIRSFVAKDRLFDADFDALFSS